MLDQPSMFGPVFVWNDVDSSVFVLSLRSSFGCSLVSNCTQKQQCCIIFVINQQVGEADQPAALQGQVRVMKPTRAV